MPVQEQTQVNNKKHTTNSYNTSLPLQVSAAHVASTSVGNSGGVNPDDALPAAALALAAAPVAAAGAVGYGAYKAGQTLYRRDKGIQQGINCKQTFSGLKCTKKIPGPLQTFHECKCAGKDRKEKRECKICSNQTDIDSAINQIKQQYPNEIKQEEQRKIEQQEINKQQGVSVGGNFIKKLTKKLRNVGKQTKRKMKGLRKQTKRNNRNRKNKLKGKKQQRGKKHNAKKSKKQQRGKKHRQRGGIINALNYSVYDNLQSVPAAITTNLPVAPLESINNPHVPYQPNISSIGTIPTTNVGNHFL